METLLKNETIAEYLLNYDQEKWTEVIEGLLEYGITMLMKQNQYEQEKDSGRMGGNKQEGCGVQGEKGRKSNEPLEPMNSNHSNSNTQSLLQRRCQEMDALMSKSLDKITRSSQYKGGRSERGIDEKLDRLAKKIDSIPTKVKLQRAPFDYY